MRLISHPVLCNYYVTYRCNARCGFCDIWERPSPYASPETVEKNLRDLKKLGVKVVDFTGGEPLLHRQLGELLSIAKSMGFITTVTTNCLLYPKYAESLRGKVDMLHFSLDSPDREEHDTMRGVRCYDFVMESIKLAGKLGERPDILFTVFETNLDRILDVWEKICLPDNLVLILNPVFGYNSVDTRSSGEQGLSVQALRELSAWAKRRNVYLNEAFLGLRRDGGNHVNSPVCKAASSSIVISPDNKLMLPCYHLGIEAIDIEDNLYTLYRSERVQKLVAMEGRYPECEGCVINCYMQPSFAVELNKYWWQALPGTLKYNVMKGTWKQLFR